MRTNAVSANGSTERAVERAVDASVGVLGDCELVAIVIGAGGTREPSLSLAASLLEEYGGVSGLGRAGIGALSALAGMRRSKAVRLAAAIELGRRAQEEAARGVALRFPESAAVVAWARPRIASLDHEELWLLALDGQNRLRAARRVAAGGLHGAHVSARDPLRIALREGASAFLLVHNHPSGDPEPSREDVAFTHAIAEGASRLGTPLVDHVVVARDGYRSLLELGLMGSA